MKNWKHYRNFFFHVATTRGRKLKIKARISLLRWRGIDIGNYNMVGDCCRITGDVSIGARCRFNHNVCIYAAKPGKVTLGNGVIIGAHVIIVNSNHNFDRLNTPIWRQGRTVKDITIADDVWIGSNSAILAGVTIGTGSVIGAGSVVTKDIPPYSVAWGAPAKVIKKR